MEKITLEEFKKTDNYKTFIEQNPTTGKLKVQVFTAYQAIPLPGVKVTVYCTIDGKIVEFFSGITDESGSIDNIELPSPNGSYKEVAMEAPKSVRYKITAEHDEYKILRDYIVNIYGGIKTLQFINMSPVTTINNGMGSVNEQQE